MVGARFEGDVDGPAAGADSVQPFSVSVLRGGCRGGVGGDTSEGELGQGGQGGGAVMLNAVESITVSGVIHAGGQGGEGSSRNSGGGGGGCGARA